MRMIQNSYLTIEFTVSLKVQTHTVIKCLQKKNSSCNPSTVSVRKVFKLTDAS